MAPLSMFKSPPPAPGPWNCAICCCRSSQNAAALSGPASGAARDWSWPRLPGAADPAVPAAPQAADKRGQEAHSSGPMDWGAWLLPCSHNVDVPCQSDNEDAKATHPVKASVQVGPCSSKRGRRAAAVGGAGRCPGGLDGFGCRWLGQLRRVITLTRCPLRAGAPAGRWPQNPRRLASARVCNCPVQVDIAATAAGAY